MMLRHENPVVTHSIHGVGCSMHRLQSQRRIELIERKYDTDRRLWDERRINKLGCLRSLRSLPFPVLILQISARPLAFVELALTKLLHSLSLSRFVLLRLAQHKFIPELLDPMEWVTPSVTIDCVDRQDTHVTWHTRDIGHGTCAHDPSRCISI